MPTASPKYVLAIDLGSGGPKVALVSDRGEVVSYVRQTVETTFLGGGGVEQDPAQWWQTISAGARELLGRKLVDAHDILAVSCTGQWSVTVPVDDRGMHLAAAVHWLDSRGAPYSQRITDGLIKVEGYNVWRLQRWLRLTGGAPTKNGADGLSHLLFLKHERPDIYARAYKLLEPTDYIAFRLCGRATASFGTVFPYMVADCRDNTRVCYDPVILRWAGIDRQKLPDLVPTGSVVGSILPEIARDWGLSTETKIVSGSCDAQTALLGSGCVADYDAHVCIGTTGWITCHVPFKKTSLSHWIATMPAGLPGRNLVVAEQGSAGKCLESFLHQWLFPGGDFGSPPPDDLYAALERVVQRVPAGSRGLMFLPWLNGAGPPNSDRYMRGGFFNQSFITGRDEAARAVLEGVALNLRWLRDAVQKFIARPLPSLRFIGGGAQMAAWGQILADVLNCPIEQVRDPNVAISRGAGVLALLGLGHIRVEDVPAMAPIAASYQPTAAHRATYDALYTEFKKCYAANRPVFRRLNEPRG